ncbi:hypothetical protein Mapa_016435 [Marchantia paleacea]|nr:hypothetical protein Mapa_016435 [Marchantia paleacea]
MGEGKVETTHEYTHESPPVEVQERGEIFFFYRPKVNMDSAHSVDDIQRMYIVLRPESGENGVEEKQSSQSGKESKFKENKQTETKDDKAEEESYAGAGTDRTDKSNKRARPNTDSDEGGNGTNEDKLIETNDYRKDEQETESEDEASSKAQGKRRKTDDGSDKHSGDERVAGKGSEVDIAKQTLLRLIVMGRKSLPGPSKRSRPYWGFVELVTTDAKDVKQALAAETYETKTRGKREKPACRPVGEGIYRLVRHKDGKKVHTHLIYKLELPGPDKHHEPQEALNIEAEGSYVIQIKNPEQGNPPTQGLQNKRKATYPAHLQDHIGSYRFVAADPPDFLNYEGCEFVLISASDDIEEELGLELGVEHMGTKERSDLLGLFGGSNNDSKAPITPLIEGEWA